MTHAFTIDDLLRFTHECLQCVGLSSANTTVVYVRTHRWHILFRVTFLVFFATTVCVAEEVPSQSMTWSLRDEFRTGAARENPNPDREDQPVWHFLRTSRSEGPVESRKWLRDGKYVSLADEGENLFGSPLDGWVFRAKEPLAPAIGRVTAEYDIGLKFQPGDILIAPGPDHGSTTNEVRVLEAVIIR